MKSFMIYSLMMLKNLNKISLRPTTRLTNSVSWEFENYDLYFLCILWNQKKNFFFLLVILITSWLGRNRIIGYFKNYLLHYFVKNANYFPYSWSNIVAVEQHFWTNVFEYAQRNSKSLFMRYVNFEIGNCQKDFVW